MARHNVNKLSLIYDKRQKDFVVKYPCPDDGSLVINKICNDVLLYRMLDNEFKYPFNFEVFNFKDELEKRGYDVTTLKFSIELKKEN